MTNPDEQGLSPLQELGYYAQALRRESPEWRSMSMSERRDEILTLVVEAADGRYVKEPEAQAKAVAELVIEGAVTSGPIGSTYPRRNPRRAGLRGTSSTRWCNIYWRRTPSS